MLTVTVPTVLVPLCGKSKDMIWLAQNGCSVVGIEYVGAAIVAFFEENAITYEKTEDSSGVTCYKSTNANLPIRIAEGDFYSITQ